jgi:hypothetical protein
VQACRQLNGAQQLAPGVQYQSQVAIEQQLPRGRTPPQGRLLLLLLRLLGSLYKLPKQRLLPCSQQQACTACLQVQKAEHGRYRCCWAE